MRVGPLILFLVCLVFVTGGLLLGVGGGGGGLRTLDSQTCLMIVLVGLIVLLMF